MSAAMTPTQVAERSGLSAGFIRECCWRSPHRHPLPSLKCGSKRPHIKIDWADFEKWRDEEATGSWRRNK